MIYVLSQKKAVRLMKQLGFKTAGGWTITQLTKKLNNVPELMEGVKLDSFTMKKTLIKITKADSVRIELGGGDKTQVETSTVAKKKKKKADEEQTEEVVGKKEKKKADEEQTEEVVGKKKKGKKGKKDKKEKTGKGKKKTSDKKDGADGKKKKSGKEDKADKKDKKAKAKTTAKGVDRFGYRLGSIKAKIGEAIGKKSKTKEEILKDTGLSNLQQLGHLNVLVNEGKIVLGKKGYKLA